MYTYIHATNLVEHGMVLDGASLRFEQQIEGQACAVAEQQVQFDFQVRYSIRRGEFAAAYAFT